jgi:hypothetical protein
MTMALFRRKQRETRPSTTGAALAEGWNGFGGHDASPFSAASKICAISASEKPKSLTAVINRRRDSSDGW